jgi:hypothetical protein
VRSERRCAERQAQFFFANSLSLARAAYGNLNLAIERDVDQDIVEMK